MGKHYEFGSIFFAKISHKWNNCGPLNVSHNKSSCYFSFITSDKTNICYWRKSERKVENKQTKILSTLFKIKYYWIYKIGIMKMIVCKQITLIDK